MDNYLIYIGDLGVLVGEFCCWIVGGCCGGLVGVGGIDGEASRKLVVRSLRNLEFCWAGCVG